MAALRYVAGESEQAGRLHALAGQLAYHLNDDDDAVDEFERAIAVAEPLRRRGDGGDQPVLLRRGSCS